MHGKDTFKVKKDVVGASLRNSSGRCRVSCATWAPEGTLILFEKQQLSKALDERGVAQ